MGNREITIEHASGTYTGRAGKVAGTSLSYDPEVGLVPVIEVQGGGWAVRLDGVPLGRVAEDANGMPTERGDGMAVSHLAHLLDAVGVSQWEALVGAPVYVLTDQVGTGVGVAHLTDESKVMVFETHAAPWLAMRQFQEQAAQEAQEAAARAYPAGPDPEDVILEAEAILEAQEEPPLEEIDGEVIEDDQPEQQTHDTKD